MCVNTIKKVDSDLERYKDYRSIRTFHTHTSTRSSVERNPRDRSMETSVDYEADTKINNVNDIKAAKEKK